MIRAAMPASGARTREPPSCCPVAPKLKSQTERVHGSTTEDGAVPTDTPGSWASSEAARRTMVANRSRDTKPEMAVRSAVHRRGLRFRVATRPLPELRRTADLVFRSAKVAVFVDGCFWHGCPEHYTEPKTNQEFWSTKIAGNAQRDRDTNEQLRAAGWTVLRFWEHEDTDRIASAIVGVVRGQQDGA